MDAELPRIGHPNPGLPPVTEPVYIELVKGRTVVRRLALKMGDEGWRLSDLTTASKSDDPDRLVVQRGVDPQSGSDSILDALEGMAAVWWKQFKDSENDLINAVNRALVRPGFRAGWVQRNLASIRTAAMVQATDYEKVAASFRVKAAEKGWPKPRDSRWPWTPAKTHLAPAVFVREHA